MGIHGHIRCVCSVSLGRRRLSDYPDIAELNPSCPSGSGECSGYASK